MQRASQEAQHAQGAEAGFPASRDAGAKGKWRWREVSTEEAAHRLCHTGADRKLMSRLP